MNSFDWVNEMKHRGTKQTQHADRENPSTKMQQKALFQLDKQKDPQRTQEDNSMPKNNKVHKP